MNPGVRGGEPRTRLHHSACAIVPFVAFISAVFAGCSEEVDIALMFEVRSPTQIKSLKILFKKYESEEQATLFQPFETTISENLEGYIENIGGEPLFVNIELRSAGRYAIHMVGEPVNDDVHALIYTTCQELDEIRSVGEVWLGPLPSGLDIDADTFPEDVLTFCNHQRDQGLPCETSCNTPEYRAMADCNPPEYYDVPLGCGAVSDDASWNPFIVDLCGDCHDQDCFGGDTPCPDHDGDGYSGESLDCNDEDATIHPGAEEICGNGIDENCAIDLIECTNGDLPCDADRDGYPGVLESIPACGNDCDDDDPVINPGTFEGCGSDPSDPTLCPGCGDGVDNNCNNQTDEGCFSDDLDNDGIPETEDCNDCNAGIGPGVDEVCGNEVDEDCDGLDLPCASTDGDRDGFDAAPSGSDCDDGDARVYPGAAERCGDGVAQNCALDVECADIVDGDGDRFGASTGDCDDADPDITPWSFEDCDHQGRDEDCDGLVNEVEMSDLSNLGCVYVSANQQWEVVNYQTNPDHCGGCRQRCCPGLCSCAGNFCEDGVCTCYGQPGCGGDPSSSCCPVGCRNLSSDVLNCGRCAHECIAGETCQPTGDCGLGECSCEWESDQGECPRIPGAACCPGVGCTTLESDPEHCGDCSNDCIAEVDIGPRGDLCSGGICYCGEVGTVCTGTAWCTTVTNPENPCGCRDLNTDVSNCGSCGSTCGDNEECNAGGCLCVAAGGPCVGDRSNYCCPGGGCVDLDRDENNCGGCGIICGWGEECLDGACRCGDGPTCDLATQDCCSGVCTNVLTDPANCGAVGTGEGCSQSCGTGRICEDGECRCEDGTMSDCVGVCDCATGDGHVCCDSICLEGQCCGDEDCSGSTNPHCETDEHRCYCRGADRRCESWERCCSYGCFLFCL